MELLFWIGLVVILGNVVFSGVEASINLLKEIWDKICGKRY